ncbi:ATP-grasp domain-containing protein [Lentzea alba]|uniref:preATP grasp domain-containing protein n=1 Tax=Lentzea alba TaxID=2714351 RepID=UPI0039BED496
MRSSDRLKLALVGDLEARFVYLGNFEVERDWAEGRPRLPGANVNFTAATVNRMEELGFFLADAGDALILKEQLAPDYRAYLAALGVVGAPILCPENSEPARRVTEDVLASPRLMNELRALADGRTYLLPLGVSKHEQLLSERVGLPLAVPGADVCAAVNSKVFGRELVARVGLRQVPGASCSDVDQVEAAIRTFLLPGGRVVLKEALGVSGRGMAVFDDESRAQRFVTMLRKRGGAVDLVVEQWVDKVTDLNYQFVISRDGAIAFETIKAAVVDSGVHRGHQFPVALPDEVSGEIHRAADLIGADLFAHGYFGVVGVDAMLSADGTLHPCLEINARLNMANYQNAIAERLLPADAAAEAGAIDVTFDSPRTFTDFTWPVRDLLMSAGDRRGVVITNFATVNAGATEGETFRGRVGVLCIGADAADAATLRAEFAKRLALGAVRT